MCPFLKSTIGALFPLPIISICHFILGLFFLAPYSPVPIFQATMECMTMKGFSMLLQTVFWGCFINSIHNMSYYMEVSSCPTLPLSWVSNCPVSKCPVSKCPVSKCPVSSCPVSSCPGFIFYLTFIILRWWVSATWSCTATGWKYDHCIWHQLNLEYKTWSEYISW